ncbi:nickel-binding protein [Agriterribacter sp.]|uniref:nickel-binding protein n=1 Tax=Agriterribacter sp. TaxID=2821509 RepID=UPI002B6F1190|nr:nickel-binding protein [Agriterribacter sp.]HRO46505.1 DUF4242 domain-containing protein [Agriterribacter sp.]HRQ17566.1 DUF4242 domain-containing protein [Agriterribacter sp.]
MPIYLDAHSLPSVTAKDVAEAHQSDLLHQPEFDCKCLTYWFDPSRNSAFCLIEAPDMDAVTKLHEKSHGLIPNKIIEVSSSAVESFLGRIHDPDDAAVFSNGLKVFSDPSFRVLMITQINDPILLQHQLGVEKTNELISLHNAIVRKNIAVHGGSEAEHSGYGLIASFTSAYQALNCALTMQKDVQAQETDALEFRISISGGEPVESNSKLFGDSIQFASHLCAITDHHHIALSSNVKELLVSYEHYQKNRHNLMNLAPPEEKFLKSLFSILEKQSQLSEFGIKDYCHFFAMSQSQVYRKIIKLTGLSFNTFLMEYRLQQAKERMKKQCYSISQITFDSGFTSPSYFTKCFKRKFGLLPKAYIDLVH